MSTKHGFVKVTQNPNERFCKQLFIEKVRHALMSDKSTSALAGPLCSGQPLDAVPQALLPTCRVPPEVKPAAPDPATDETVITMLATYEKNPAHAGRAKFENWLRKQTAAYEEDKTRYNREMEAYTTARQAYVRETTELGPYNKQRSEMISQYSYAITVIINSVVVQSDRAKLIWDHIPGAAAARDSPDPAALIACFQKYMSDEGNHGCDFMRLVDAYKRFDRVLKTSVKNGRGELPTSSETITSTLDDFHVTYEKVCSSKQGRDRFGAAVQLLTLDPDVHGTYLSQEMYKLSSDELSATLPASAHVVTTQASLQLYSAQTAAQLQSGSAHADPSLMLDKPTVNQGRLQEKKRKKQDGHAPTGNKSAKSADTDAEKSARFCQRCKNAGKSVQAYSSHDTNQCRYDGSTGAAVQQGNNNKPKRDNTQGGGTTNAKSQKLQTPVNPNNLPPRKQGNSALAGTSKKGSLDDEFPDCPVSISEEDYFSSRGQVSRGTFAARSDRKTELSSDEETGCTTHPSGRKHRKTLDFGAQASIARRSSLTDIVALKDEEIIEGIGGEVIYSFSGVHKRLGISCLLDDKVTNDLIAPCDLESRWDFVGAESLDSGKDSKGRDVVTLGAVKYRDRDGLYSDARFERAPADSPNRGLLVLIDEEDCGNDK